MATSRQIATAYHEASRAVTAVWLGIGLRKKGVSIEPDEDSLGRVYTRKSIRGNPEFEGSDAQRAKAEKKVVVFLAGHEGQRKFCPRARNGGGKDRVVAVDLISYFVGSERELNAYMKLLYIRTEQIIGLEHVQEMIGASGYLVDRGAMSRPPQWK